MPLSAPTISPLDFPMVLLFNALLCPLLLAANSSETRFASFLHNYLLNSIHPVKEKEEEEDAPLSPFPSSSPRQRWIKLQLS